MMYKDRLLMHNLGREKEKEILSFPTQHKIGLGLGLGAHRISQPHKQYFSIKQNSSTGLRDSIEAN